MVKRNVVYLGNGLVAYGKIPRACIRALERNGKLHEFNDILASTIFPIKRANRFLAKLGYGPVQDMTAADATIAREKGKPPVGWLIGKMGGAYNA